MMRIVMMMKMVFSMSGDVVEVFLVLPIFLIFGDRLGTEALLEKVRK